MDGRITATLVGLGSLAALGATFELGSHLHRHDPPATAAPAAGSADSGLDGLPTPQVAPEPGYAPGTLATLHYVIRPMNGEPGGANRTADIDAVADAKANDAVRVTGSFAQAVAVARTRASKVVVDDIHSGPLFQAQGVMQAGEGAYVVAGLSGHHRGADGPIFVDGGYFNRFGLAAWGSRRDASVQAIVGSESIIDLRNQADGNLEQFQDVFPLPVSRRS